MTVRTFLIFVICPRAHRGGGRKPADVVKGGKRRYQLRFSTIRRIFSVQAGFSRIRPKIDPGTESA